MTVERDEVLGQGVLRAATRALNLCFAGVTATSSVILHSWPMFGASLAGYAALVVWDLSRLGFWTRVLQDLRTRPPTLPDPDFFTETASRHFATRLQQARCELRKVIGMRRRWLPARLQKQVELLPELERRAVVLLDRLEEVSRYMADKNVRGLRNEVERLRRASENTTNVRLRAEYRRAQVALEEELASLDQVTASRELLVARLETVTGTLEMFPCAVVRLQVMEADVRDHTAEATFDPRSVLPDADADELDDILASAGLALSEPAVAGKTS